jgi:hypothetical protein
MKVALSSVTSPSKYNLIYLQPVDRPKNRKNFRTPNFLVNYDENSCRIRPPSLILTPAKKQPIEENYLSNNLLNDTASKK